MATLCTQPLNSAACTGTFTSTEQGKVDLKQIPAHVLERVCQYFYYKLEHQNSCASSHLQLMWARVSLVTLGAPPPVGVSHSMERGVK